MNYTSNNSPFSGIGGISFFLTPYILFFIVLLAALVQYPKAELHLLMNANHTPFNDFFSLLDRNWWRMVPFVFLGLLLFYRYSWTIYLLVAQFLGGIVSVIAKRAFDEPRPLLYFRENFPEINLPLVENIRIYTAHSFPSGHTITAFALFFGLALIFKKRWLNLLFFVMAALVGYSRVYLSQHFAIDILVGSAIGIISAWVCYPLLGKMDEKWDEKSLTNNLIRKNRKLLAKNQK